MTPRFTEYPASPQLKDIWLNNLHLLFVFFVNPCSAGIHVYYGVYYPRRYWNKVSFNWRSSFLLHSRKPKCLDKFGLFWKMSLFKIKTAAPTINQLMPPEKMFLNMDHSGLFFFIFIFPMQLTVTYKSLLMTGFEWQTSGVGSDRCTNWATTTAPTPDKMFLAKQFISLSKLWAEDIFDLNFTNFKCLH